MPAIAVPDDRDSESVTDLLNVVRAELKTNASACAEALKATGPGAEASRVMLTAQLCESNQKLETIGKRIAELSDNLAVFGAVWREAQDDLREELREAEAEPPPLRLVRRA